MAAPGGSLPDLSTIPLAPNPNGDPPDFTGGPSLFPTVVVTGLTFIVLSFPFVVVRIHTGIKKSGRLFADDCRTTHSPLSVLNNTWLTNGIRALHHCRVHRDRASGLLDNK